ncbi:hypothetical protein [Parasitella parasitica]|uniref:Uncharacterized protein n=1 Tax=Parasitella parasitica TaxID=35722 RepID=A0A0B7N7S1_9FUNG|nr:hypothetical protein [Parasitella parasitica]
MDSLKEKGVRGVRLFITRERLKIYEEALEERQSFQLKVFDLINYVLDEIEYGCLPLDSFELDYTVYWVKMFNFMLRKSEIKIKIGEPCCAATKLDREINEFDIKDTEQKNIVGRRVDVIFVGLLEDVGPIELASAEIKPANATEDMQRLDLNKNIRTNKSILNNLNMLVNGGNEAL